MTEILKIDNLIFEVRRSTRRKTISLTVDRGGELVIHVPEGLADDELTSWTSSKLLWVYSKLAIREELTPQVNEPEYVTGERIGYLGRSYRLRIVKIQDEPLLFNGSEFLLRQDDRPAAHEHFRQWYISRGTEWVKNRTKMLKSKTETSPARIEVCDLGYRWGSCGKNHTLYFNWKGLQLPVRLLDYLLLHELIHLTVPNHGPAFWRSLDRALPDWKQRKDELQLKARDLFWCGVLEGA